MGKSLAVMAMVLAAAGCGDAAGKPFGDRVAETWSTSWAAFVELVQVIAISLIASAPWLPVILVVIGGIWYLSRRSRANPGTPASAEGGPRS